MESVPQRRPTLREIMRRPLCRHEMRAAATPAAMAALYAIAGLIGLAGFWALCSLELLDDYGQPGYQFFLALAAGGGTVLVAILLVPALMAPAIAGEREQGTLDALLLAPLDRRELVWAKFLGRNRPAWRFMLAAAPGSLSGVAVIIAETTYAYLVNSSDVSASEAWMTPVLVVASVSGAVLFWLLSVVVVFCLAAVVLYVSALVRKSFTAGLIVYVGLWALGGFALVACLVLGPVLFRRLIRGFDRYVLL